MITEHRWTSTDDQGQVRLIIVDECDGLVQVTHEILRELMVRSGIRQINAGQSIDLPGRYVLRYPDLAGLLAASGMVRAS